MMLAASAKPQRKVVMHKLNEGPGFFERKLAEAKVAAKQFEAEFARLQKNKAAAKRDPKLWAEWQRLEAKGGTVKKWVLRVMQWGADGARWAAAQAEAIKDFVRGTGKKAADLMAAARGAIADAVGLGELGVAPVVAGIAAVGVLAALYLMRDWLAEGRSFNARVESYYKLRDKGLTHEQATQVIERGEQAEQNRADERESSGLFGNLKTVAIWGGVALVVYALLSNRPRQAN
ncbi:hypothetical protein [Leeia sp.]|uniref:hypothetical protein n=1 Tax=Leeia sp. TaxID=2884678 RepID=UPI0035B44CD9